MATRKDAERTQWISGDGDGLLVWDHNGNGIIDDTTELMSEFDIKGEHAFANGLEKLAHYFDKDGNGVVEAHEMQGLMFWIDDGDAKTEEGELIPPWKLGITQIVVPVLKENLPRKMQRNYLQRLPKKSGKPSKVLSLLATSVSVQVTIRRSVPPD